MDSSSENSSKNIALCLGGLCTVTARTLGLHLNKTAGYSKDGNSPNEQDDALVIPLRF